MKLSMQKRHRPIRSFACQTKESPTNLPSTAAGDLAVSQKNLAALKGAGDAPGIKALKRVRRFQVPSRAGAAVPDLTEFQEEVQVEQV